MTILKHLHLLWVYWAAVCATTYPAQLSVPAPITELKESAYVFLPPWEQELARIFNLQHRIQWQAETIF